LSDISIIVAVDKRGGFAKQHKIPWYYKEDFAHFKKITIGHPCVMGRNTHAEINEKLGEKAHPSVLPGRTCYVVSTTLKELPNAAVVRSLNDVPEDRMFVIGGKQLYDQALRVANTVYITHIGVDYQCDQFFDLDYVASNFTAIEATATVSGELTFITYKRTFL